MTYIDQVAAKLFYQAHKLGKLECNENCTWEEMDEEEKNVWRVEAEEQIRLDEQDYVG